MARVKQKARSAFQVWGYERYEPYTSQEIYYKKLVMDITYIMDGRVYPYMYIGDPIKLFEIMWDNNPIIQIK